MMGRILSADRLKAKRTWIGILVVLGPLGVISLQAVNYGLRYDFLVTPGSDVWGDLVRNIHQILVPTLLLGITLLASMLAGLEHQAQAWKLMFALPVSKVHAYVGKFLRLAVLLLISAALAGIGTVLLGVSLGFGPEIPWVMTLGEGYFPYLAAFPVMALQFWVSMLVRNQAFPMTLGIIGVMMSTSLSFNTSLDWVPWAYPVLAAPLEAGRYNPEKWIAVGLVVGVVVLWIGALHFAKRDVK